MEQKYTVTGMTCSACSSKVEKCVSNLEGIGKVSVNLLTGTMQAEYEEDVITSEEIMKTVEKAGYHAFVEEVEKGKSRNATEKQGISKRLLEEQEAMKKRFLISLVFLIPLMYVSMGSMWGAPLPSWLLGHKNAVSFAFTQLLLCIPILYVNQGYFIRGFKALLHKSPNMDSLVAVGSAASLLYGIFAIYRISYGLGQGDMELVSSYHMDLYFESAAMILTLITLGKYFESKSKGKTGKALEMLMDMAPKMAVVEREGVEQEIPVEEIVVGDILLIGPGSRIPADGIVIEGRGSVDESAITGESIPVEKEPSKALIGATINQNGFLKMKATKVGEDTAFAGIIRLVEQAGATKAPIAKLADKIAGIFVPVVMVIALVTGIVWMVSGGGIEFALSSAISVLVISCPCALGLATPVAIMAGTGKGAQYGILVRSGEALEAAHGIDTVVLDKTGTITWGKPVVTDILSYDRTEAELLQIAASLEKRSEHPLAEAVMTYAKEQGIKETEPTSFEAIPGKGVLAKIGEKQYYAGNQKWMEELKMEHVKRAREDMSGLASQGKTPLIFAEHSSIIGIIAVADTVKDTSKEAIAGLREMGLRVIMLTGDNKQTAEGIAKGLHLDQVIAEVLPGEKEQVIAELKAEGKKVAMVGDGINDAPALVSADVGIAIGAGTDVAMESADIILMHSDLLDVAAAVSLSKAVLRNIKQNLFWAFFYNCLGIPLAAGIFYPLLGLRLTPMFGAAAMSFSSLFVVGNALRLNRFQYNRKKSNTATVPIEEKDIVIKEENKMTIKIEGMMCQNCVKHVKKALESVEGVTAEVSLEKQEAVITKPDHISQETLKAAVEEEGYKCIEFSL